MSKIMDNLARVLSPDRKEAPPKANLFLVPEPGPAALDGKPTGDPQ
jgi:hypothetical protein